MTSSGDKTGKKKRGWLEISKVNECYRDITPIVSYNCQLGSAPSGFPGQIVSCMKDNRSTRIFYGWWIVVAAFLNLFFAVGIIFYGFPVFYPAFVESLGFTRVQVTQGFLLGFLIVGLPFGFAAGALIDRIGSRWIILAGAGLIGVSLFLMGFMTRFWEYELLCIAEVLGFVLAGPIANQVLIARWFRRQRGRAMGFAFAG
jgi:MFS family permease